MTSPTRSQEFPSVLSKVVAHVETTALAAVVLMVATSTITPTSFAQAVHETDGSSPGQHESTSVGSEFQVNTSTYDAQFVPSVDADASGNFVVTWSSFESTGTDTDGASIQLQRYQADGTPIGEELQVNTDTTASQNLSAVSVAPDGRFVIVWQSRVPPGGFDDPWTVEGQRFDADGSPVGDQFQVGSAQASRITYPAVAISPVGDFVVVWRADAPEGATDYANILGQLFDSDGFAIGSEFTVNAATTGFENRPDVEMDGDGRFVVVWQDSDSTGSDSDNYSVQARRFAADGTPVGDDFQINTYTTSTQYFPSVAVEPQGSFVVVWESTGSSGDDSIYSSIQGQRYDAAGAAVGGEFQVNTTTANFQYFADVTYEPTGAFLVTWSSDGTTGDDTSAASVQTQRFDVSGNPTGSEFQVNTSTLGTQWYPTPTPTSAGNFVILWQSAESQGDDNEDLSIQGQRFVLDSFLFADGFESGDTTAWGGGS